MAQYKSLLFLLLLVSTGWCQAEISREARLALAGRHYTEAISILEPAAASGDADCAYELGKLYRLGKGVEADQTTAAYWFNIASTAGHLPAGYLLAETYLDLDRTGEARSMMNSLAAAGYPNAQRWLERQSTSNPVALLAAIAADAPVGQYSFEEMARPDSQGVTPLIVATRNNSSNWVSRLLDAGVNPDHQDNLGYGALHYAVSTDNEQLAQLLLDAGADPDVQTTQGASALHIAIAAEDVAMSQRLLSANAKTSIPDEGGWTAAELASRSDNNQLRQTFGLGAKQTSTGTGAAHRRLADAARTGDLATLEELISADTDVETRNGDGDSPLSLAIKANQPGAVKSLFKHYPIAAQREALFTAARAGQPKIMQWLLTQLGTADLRSNTGEAPLATAIKANCADCVSLLLAAGSSVELSNPSGEPLLISAARTGNTTVVNMLTSTGADINVVDPQQRSALWWSASQGDTVMTKHLLELGATQFADADGLAPLHIAAAENHGETTGALITPKNLNAATESGNTALMLAASRNATAALEELIQQQAELESRNGGGNTALILATMAGAYESAGLLLAAGADDKARNNKFESSRSIVERREDVRWLALLDDNRKPGLMGLFN